MVNLEELSDLSHLEPVDLALHWAARGVPVVPTNPSTKAPWVGVEWERKATRDPEQIRTLWRLKPNARVGVKTGLACGCGCLDGPDVLDFDVSDGKPGLDQLRTLVDAGVIDGTKALRVVTPSGGQHWWFEGSTAHNKQNDDAVWGVDLRAHHGMVLAPGNPGYTVKGVPWSGLGPSPTWAAVAACPGVKVKPGSRQTVAPVQRPAPLTSRFKAPLQPEVQNAPGEESPLDWFSRTNSFHHLLLADGWTWAYEHQGRQHYRRPGKQDEGVSANVFVNPDGRETLRNFSTTVDLPLDVSLSPAQYYAYTRHRGNLREAAKTVRATLMPVRTPPPVPLTAPPPSAPVVSGTDAPRPPDSSRGESPGAELVPVSEVGPPELVTSFWEQRWELRQIRQFARERRVSPWAALGSVLALVTCRVGPHVVLPPIVGGVASLNLLVGLVGPSGKGKGASWAVAEEYLGVKGQFPQEEVGTSQGIDSCFTETTPKQGTVQFNDVAFFYVPEVDTVKSHSEMAGSSLLPTLRKVWSGEALGARYAKSENRRSVRAHAYRASVVAGIQPARSGVLLADVDGGTPQRWLWLPVHDPDALRRTDRLKPPRYVGTPPLIDYDVWVPEGEQRGEKGEPLPVTGKARWEVEVCRQAWDEIIDAREENLVNEHSSIDSHSLLTRLKVAAALAFLDRRASVTEEDWDLAKAVLWVSNATRAVCFAAVAEAEAEEHARRGRGRAIQDATADVARVQLKDDRVARIQELGGKLLGALQASPGVEFSPKQLRELLGDTKARKEYWAEVEKALLATPGVVQGPEVSSGGRKIRKLSWGLLNGPSRA